MRINSQKSPLTSLRAAVEKKLEQTSSRIQSRFVDAFDSVRRAGQVVHRRDDLRYDGALVAPGGEVVPATTPLSALFAAEPKGGAGRPGTVVYVNGMGIDKDRQAAELQQVADQVGAKVVGLHNATSGWAGDFPQATADKLDLGHNPAVEALKGLVLSELDAGNPVELMAHSHGALITSRALSHVAQALATRGLGPLEVEQAMGRISVETFGGAASSYPDGPRYVHYVNRADVQSAVYGMGLDGDPRRRQAGSGARFVSFWDPHLNPVVTHDFPGTYLPQRKPA